MKKFNFMYGTLISMGGGDKEVLAHCTSEEVNRFVIRGALIFIPTVLAFWGMYLMAFFSSKSVVISSLCASTWAFIVFLIDRSLMAQSSDSISWGLVGRILFAILNSLVVAECILVIIFADSIQSQKDKVFESAKLNIEQRYEQVTSKFRQDIVEHEVLKNNAEKTYFDEIDGNGGSRNRGFGSISAEKLKALNSANRQLDSVKAIAASNILTSDSLKLAEIEELSRNRSKDLASSLDMLHGIGTGYIPLATWMIRLLLLLVELMPVFLKFGSSKPDDIYKYALKKMGQKKKDEMDLILLNEMELIKAKTQYSTIIARQQAAYDNSLEELDLYTNFINEMAARQATDIPIIENERDNFSDRVSSKWKELLDRFAA
ncbi:MAG: DUF4407 domain-containing protein [Saprospiraceae bacterium]|jgi:hypothetical protein|nr:DUF4407 domain-containing protein [Saprospiraceae bacterium]MBP9196253.1 DUF4407 domain-containing protein [Saprospiraceae bacterium]